MNIMLDLETMGTEPGCAIVAIGAVKFDSANGVYPDGFYKNVSLKSCMQKGLSVDGDTIMWWLKQDDAARKALIDHTEPIRTALLYFSEWANKDPDPKAPVRSVDPYTKLWGCGPDFDNAILKAAFDKCSIHWPFHSSTYRDYRTYRDLLPTGVEMPARTSLHSALADAVYEASVMVAIAAYRALVL